MTIHSAKRSTSACAGQPLGIIALCLVMFSGYSIAADMDSPGPNINIVRQAEGRYSYRTLSDGRDRGIEKFQLLVHPDGSRTLMMWHDLWARNAQFTVVLRVAENFRPLSAYTSYWVANGYKGSTTFQVNGDKLIAHGAGANGPVEQQMDVPEQFSIGTHPVSGDGWHLWYAPSTPSFEGAINLFSLEATPDLSKPILGQLVEMPYEVIGTETITTPAGEFETTHYRLMGASDLWVTGPDRILVKMTQERFDREYLLQELTISEPGLAQQSAVADSSKPTH